jgi:hypothetical protein
MCPLCPHAARLWAAGVLWPHDKQRHYQVSANDGQRQDQVSANDKQRRHMAGRMAMGRGDVLAWGIRLGVWRVRRRHLGLASRAR